jgi:hypothetical protein
VALASPRSTMLMASTPGRNERNNNDRPSVRTFIRPAIQSGPSSHGRQPWGERCIDNSRRRDQRFKNVRETNQQQPHTEVYVNFPTNISGFPNER